MKLYFKFNSGEAKSEKHYAWLCYETSLGCGVGFIYL